jgi:acyl carrier protein
MSLEEKFGITIDAGDAQRFVTVGDAIAFVKGEVDRF